MARLLILSGRSVAYINRINSSGSDCVREKVSSSSYQRKRRKRTSSGDSTEEEVVARLQGGSRVSPQPPKSL